MAAIAPASITVYTASGVPVVYSTSNNCKVIAVDDVTGIVQVTMNDNTVVWFHGVGCSYVHP